MYINYKIRQLNNKINKLRQENKKLKDQLKKCKDVELNDNYNYCIQDDKLFENYIGFNIINTLREGRKSASFLEQYLSEFLLIDTKYIRKVIINLCDHKIIQFDDHLLLYIDDNLNKYIG